MGLGVEGHGWELGQKMECWHWPQCCTRDHCPSINSVAAFIKTAVAKGGNYCPDRYRLPIWR